MSKDAFVQREKSLENEFFYRVDQELIHRLQQKAEEAEGRQRLAQVTGITDSSVLDELLEEGIQAETLVAMSLVPLIRVAFADRILDAKERAAVLDAAETLGVTSETGSYQLMSFWLEHQPEERLFEVWRHYVQALGQVASADSFQHLKDRIIQRARDIAVATGGFLGIHKISEAEHVILDEVERAFDESSPGSVTESQQ